MAVLGIESKLMKVIKNSFIEESYEVIDAIEEDDDRCY